MALPINPLEGLLIKPYVEPYVEPYEDGEDFHSFSGPTVDLSTYD